MDERVAAAALGQPQGAIAPGLDPFGEGRTRCRGHSIHTHPNAELAEFHRRALLCGRRLSAV